MVAYRAVPDVPDEVHDAHPYSTWILWPNRRRGPWLVRVEWLRVHGRLECGGIELRAYRNPGEHWPPELPTSRENPEILTATTIRKLPIGAIIHDLREEGWERTQANATWWENEGDSEFADALRRDGARNRGSRRRGVPPLPEVATVYQEAVDRRDHPTEAVATRWKVAHSTAAKWVMRARRDGHLPAVKRKGRKP